MGGFMKTVEMTAEEVMVVRVRVRVRVGIACFFCSMVLFSFYCRD
jgi:hypothetical protein